MDFRKSIIEVFRIIDIVYMFCSLDIAKSILIVSPLKANSVAALQFQFYLYEYLPNTVSKSPSVREMAPYCWTSVQVRERGPKYLNCVFFHIL
ncbi:MAG: hypothetical protein QF365_03655 [Candidatus Thalassarchaeaceae archaeon]|nr:hypothetical protein [Candidatus Thalassarchaeaceae archaeon]